MTDEVSRLAQEIIPRISELNPSYQAVKQLNTRYLIVVLTMLLGSIIAFWFWTWNLIIPYISFIIIGIYLLYRINIKLNKTYKELDEAFLIFRDSIKTKEK